MIGSIIGDIVGYPYQNGFMAYTDATERIDSVMGRVTDDSVLTIAVADAILNDDTENAKEYLLKWFNKYPEAGYGPGFYEWASNGGTEPMTSIGNGAAMRISPVGWAYFSDVDVSIFNEQYQKFVSITRPSHDSDEAYNGAYSISAIIAKARMGHSMDMIKEWAVDMYSPIEIGVSLHDMIAKWDKQSCRCDITVPQAINCFLLSDSYEDCIRKCLLSQGDVDTIATMAGGIAEAYYWKQTGELPIPKYLINYAKNKIPFDMMEIYMKFRDKYNLPKYW